MKARPSAILAVFIGALTIPALSSASSVWHPVNSEASYSYHPDHATSARSGDDVMRELETSQANGTWYYLQRAEADGSLTYLRQAGVAVERTPKSAGQAPLNTSPEEQRRIDEVYRRG